MEDCHLVGQRFDTQPNDLKMNAASFYGKPAGGPRPRAPPVDSDDSCLSESGDSDEESTPEPGDENGSSSDEDADGTHHAPQSTSAAAARGKPDGKKSNISFISVTTWHPTITTGFSKSGGDPWRGTSLSLAVDYLPSSPASSSLATCGHYPPGCSFSAYLGYALPSQTGCQVVWYSAGPSWNS
ncbi:uncharacterized protein KZ484_014103 isoform 1-T1 [Pholidichthys leucotaenia]